MAIILTAIRIYLWVCRIALSIFCTVLFIYGVALAVPANSYQSPNLQSRSAGRRTHTLFGVMDWLCTAIGSRPTGLFIVIITIAGLVIVWRKFIFIKEQSKPAPQP